MKIETIVSDPDKYQLELVPAGREPKFDEFELATVKLYRNATEVGLALWELHNLVHNMINRKGDFYDSDDLDQNTIDKISEIFMKQIEKSDIDIDSMIL